MVRAIEVTAWAALCVGIWLLTLSSATLADLCVAAPVGLLCGALATAGRRLAGGRWHPRPRWAAWLLTLPVAVMADTFGVWRAAARAALDPVRAGANASFSFPPTSSRMSPPPDAPSPPSRYRASPGSYVLDFDPTRRELLIHTLADSAPSWARLDLSR